jgi:GNAT superfamily N-acetyltransferase
MRIERFDPADTDAVRACYDIYLAGTPADDPDGPPMSPRHFSGWLKLGWTEDPREHWLARDAAGAPCGWYVLGLPGRENLHLAGVSPAVPPSLRRTGLGTTLVRHAAARADELGRTALSGNAREGSPGAAFASALGARRGLTDERRVLEVATLTADRLTELRRDAESAARAYSLLSWDGPVPAEHLAGVAAINAAVAADIPHSDGHEPQRWDSERVRQNDRREAAQGLRGHTVVARCAATGELAGLTQLSIDPVNPAWGYQDLTAVTGQHRGHKLGLLVKVGMLDLLAEREPQLTRVITDNAEENQHMIAINTELGFSVLDRWASWEIAVRRALAAGIA